MYDTSSFLFWYKIIFVFELLIAESLFSFRLAKNKKFLLKYFLSIIILSLFSLTLPIIYDAFYIAFMFFCVFLVSIILLKFCFKGNRMTILFCAIAGYTTQHLAYLINEMVFDYLYIGKLFELIANTNPYVPGDFNTLNFSVVTIIAYLTVYFCTYWIIYFVCAYRIKKDKEPKISNAYLLALAGLIVIIDIYFNMITSYNVNIDDTSLLLERIYNLLICAIAISLQFSLLDKKQVEDENKIVKALLTEKKNQYNLAKKNIDLINIKVHDLKHTLAYLETKNAPQSELSNIRNLIENYEAFKTTNNETLNIILNEKTIECKKLNINFDIIANGDALSFIDESDLYTLLGNAIDNAIEATRKVSDANRYIGMQINKKGNLVFIHLENTFNNVLNENNGKLITTKDDNQAHGYGILSMQIIAAKYGGTISHKVKNNIFELNILLVNNSNQV